MGGAVVALALPAAAHAQNQDAAEESSGGLQEIVVTAQHREERLQDVPIAVSAVAGDTLLNSGISGTRDLPQIVPSVQMTRSGPSGLFFIRGVGTTNAAAGEEGANAFYIDDVYMGDLGQTINNFNNVERIEVLKGPQGTLFGRNATGGLIHIITRDPGDRAVMKAQAGYANYGTISSQLYAAVPITDTLSADFAWTNTYQEHGWGRNVTTGADVHVQNYWGMRSKIVFRPLDTVKFTLGGDIYRNRDNLGLAWRLDDRVVGTGGQLSPGGYDTSSNQAALTDQRNWGINFKGEVELGFAKLTSVSAYRKSHNHSYFDVDGGPLNLINIDYLSDAKTVQQELRLASTSTEPFSWQLGGFYLRSEASTSPQKQTGLAFSSLGFPNGQQIDSRLVTDSYAVFGEATYSLTPSTKLTGGLRYTMDRRTFNGLIRALNADGSPGATIASITNSKLSYNALTWRVALHQEITPDISLYGSVNRGFKAGSYSLHSPPSPPVKPQYIMAYEVGLKSELFDRRLRVNLSAYHYDIDDYQIRSAAVATPGSSVLLNAATVKVDGIDLDFEAQPTERLHLFGGFTYLNSRFSQFGGPGVAIQAPIVYDMYVPGETLANSCADPALGLRDPGLVTGTTPIGGLLTCLGNVSGNKTPLAPSFVGTIGATYSVPVGASGEVRLSALYTYNSGYYFEPDNRFSQPAFGLLNASIEYRPLEHLGIELWGRNLTKSRYIVQDLSTGTGTTAVLGAPQTYGVNLKIDF